MNFPLIETDIFKKTFAFCMTWNIDNFVVCPKKFGEPLYSPVFTVGCLGATRWRLILYPRGSKNPNFISCYLERLSDDSMLEEIIVNFRFYIYNLGECDSSVCAALPFTKNQIWGIANYKQRKIFEKILQTSFLDKLILKCELSPSDVRVSSVEEKLHMHILLTDYNHLYENGHLHDIVLKCKDRDFKAHRAIIFARAPKLAAEIKIDSSPEGIWKKEINNMTPNALNCLLLYLYSGRLVLLTGCLLAELFEIAGKYDLPDLQKRLKSYPRYYNCCTSMNVEYKYVYWRVQRNASNNFEMLTKIIPLERENVENLIIQCYPVSKTRDIGTEHIYLSFSFCSFDENKPISIGGDISLLDNRGCLLGNYQDYMFFESNDEWKIPFQISINKSSKEFIINCSLTLCYGERYTCIESSSGNTELYSSSIVDYRALCLDFNKLLTSVSFFDVSLIAENVCFPAHKFILTARSRVFKQMFECDMIEKCSGLVNIIDLSAETIKCLLNYIYTGHIDPLCADFVSLYNAADKYEIIPLVKSCSFYLMNTLNIENSCHILIVAYRHCDDELQIRAKRFISLHFSEVKKTFSWQMISNTFKHLSEEISSDTGFFK